MTMDPDMMHPNSMGWDFTLASGGRAGYSLKLFLSILLHLQFHLSSKCPAISLSLLYLFLFHLSTTYIVVSSAHLHVCSHCLTEGEPFPFSS